MRCGALTPLIAIILAGGCASQGEAQLQRDLAEVKEALAAVRADVSTAIKTIEALRAELQAARHASAPAQPPDQQDMTVYVTRTGTKYHRAGCRYLRQSSTPISLRDARRSYSPCSVCGPP